MFASLLEYYREWMEISKTNPIMASFFGVWVAGLITYIVRNVPLRIYTFLKNQCMTSLTFNDAGWDNMYNYGAFLEWFKNQNGASLSRSYSIRTAADDYRKTIMGIGFGNHLLFYKRRLFIVNLSQLPSQGSSTEKHQITVIGFTRNKELIAEMVEDFRFKPNQSKMSTFCFTGKDWERFREIEPRPLSTVISAGDVKNQIVEQIQRWLDNETWYRSRGMTYKLSYVLHGVPGTGKTSLIKAIASHFGFSVYILSLDRLYEYSAGTAMLSIPKNSVLLVEDFDASKAVHRRSLPPRETSKLQEGSAEQDTTVAPPVEPSAMAVAVSPLSEMFDGFGREANVSTILNVLDGVVALDSVILFFTTNHLEKIDPAMLRKGRVSHIYEIAKLRDREVRQYIKLMFPDVEVSPTIVFEDIAGCDLEALFLDAMDDHEMFIKSIPKRVGNLIRVSDHTHPDNFKRVMEAA